MFQVLLCDDEISVTNFLKNSIPWESLGIETVHTASNGEEALRLFEQHTIHLLISDIRMPRMDGIELLNIVREKYPDTHCILLTAYGEFEYARAALRLGVNNYLLKPIQIVELTDTIENAVENMYIHRKNETALFRDNILRRWLTGNISEDELAERSNLLEDVNIYQSAYCAVCMNKSDKNISISAFAEQCISKLTPHYDCLHVWDNSGRYILIVSGTDIDRTFIMDVMHETAEQLDTAHKFQAVIGSIVDQSEQLSQSYQQAVKLLDSLGGQTSSYICMVSDGNTISTGIENINSENLSPIIQKALTYIHSEYSNGVSIKEFCVKHTITTAYLGFLFKKETNTFFNNYLNAYRIEKASDMLVHTQERVKTIAEKTGFTSTSYFISSFKKHTGMSPQKYRELYQ